MGGDGELAEGKSLKISFNPHSHMGSDLVDTSAGKQAGSFNPHSHMGSDTRRLNVVKSFFVFQSTLPHGE